MRQHYRDGVTVVIPHIPPRAQSLTRAISSVDNQTLPPAAVCVQYDSHHNGSALTRNRALESVTTEWVAFLDDDDYFLPHHLDEIMRCAETWDADVVYPGGIVHGGHDPHDRFGKPFDPDLLRQKSYIPVTSLVKTHLAVRAEFGPPEHAPESDYDDWGFYLRLLEDGAKIVHHPVKSWVWNHGPQNTSGRGDRWV